MNKIIHILKFIIGWPLSIIALLFILKIIAPSVNVVLGNIFKINILYLFLALLSFFVYFFLRSVLWKQIVDRKGNKLNLKSISYIWAFSELKRYIPGNIWSILARGTSSLETGLDKKAVANSLIVEIELIILACYILSLPFILYFSWGTIFNHLFLLLGIAMILLFVFGNKINKFSFLFPGSNYAGNVKLFLIALANFFMFGLGTFFAIISLFYLNLNTILIIVSLSIFSLLAGYVSLITPMGLGVREGVMTLYLSRFITASSAGLVSIFSRIVLISSEIIFLLFVLAWNKIKNIYLIKLEDFVSKHKHELCLGLLVFIYIFYFTVASFLRYDNFFTGRFDLGNMDQAVWNTIHGRIFQITDPNGTSIISRLAFHADFILVLISPLYLIWSNPKMLLLLQSIILGGGAVYVFLIAKELLKNKSLSLFFASIYLLNPALQYANLYDFHPVTLGTTFLLACFYYFLKRKYLLFIIFAVLAGLTKEHVWAIISIFGLAIILRLFWEIKFKIQTFSKENISETVLGILLILIPTGIFYYLIWHAIPVASGGQHFALSYYSDFGNTASNVAKSMLFSPLKIVTTAFQPAKLLYLFQLLFPLGFLSVLSPIVLLFTAPDLAVNLLSNNAQLHQIFYQYTSTITPFLFIAAVYSVRFLNSRFKKMNKNLFIIYLLSTTLISAYLVGPLPGSLRPNIDMFNKQLPNNQIVENFISTIPTRYSIAATNNLGSHLSRRQKIYTIPIGIDQADVVLFLLNDPFAQPSLQTQKDMVMQMKNDKKYLQVFKNGDFIAFEKRDLYTQAKTKPKKGQVNLFPYSITALSNRSYQKSDIVIERKVGDENFKSYIISFTSDGLKEYALMNIPNTEKPVTGFPVLILAHGYIQPNTYDTIYSYKSESDYFAKQGFLVLKPDYRGNGNSEITNQALMRFAYPIDVLNLIASVENIPSANTKQIFLWSHSMGGEVILEVLEAAAKNKDFASEIKGAIFWAPVTNPVKWFSKNHLPALQEATITPYPYQQTFKILGTPDKNPQLWQSLSPLNYLNQIENVPILLQHGTADTTVPHTWSVELNNDLLKLNKLVRLISYPNDTHNLPLSWSKATNDDLIFLEEILNK